MKKFVGLALVLAIGMAAVIGTANADKKKEGVAATCPVSGKAINPKAAVDYKGGKVYFCCPACPKAFAKNTAKFANKANHQLALTGQATQVACPVAGKEKTNPKTKIDVAGVGVVFCCNGCKGKASKAEDKVAFVFNDKAFAKGFKVASAKKE
jgi:YHS domain-containing protein